MFDSEEYLLPVIMDDPLLQMDHTNDDSITLGQDEMSLEERYNNMCVLIPYLSLSYRLAFTEHKLSVTNTALQTALQGIQSMK